MKTCEIEVRILELESTIKQLYTDLYRNILNKIDDVLYFHKEYTEYEDAIFKWLKSYKDDKNPGLITYRLFQAYENAIKNNCDTISLIHHRNSYWDKKVAIIPTSLAKLIIDEFNK